MPSDDFFIRRFARFRDAGDMNAAMDVWKQAVERQADYVKIRIRGFQFPVVGGGLNRNDREDAQMVCLLRILQMGHNFRGHTGAEFRAAMNRAVFFGCMDVGRETMHYEMGIGGSLDERYEDSDVGRHEAAVARFLGRDGDVVADTIEDEAERDAIVELVQAALAQMDNENYRIVLELTFIEGLTGEEIAERLDISIDNVYQRRKRGLEKLEAILRDHRP